MKHRVGYRRLKFATMVVPKSFILYPLAQVKKSTINVPQGTLMVEFPFWQ